MEVKKGFKFGEVGTIPVDWKCGRIGEFATTSSGTTPSRRLQERYYHNGSINWIKTLDLNNGEITTTDEKVTQAAINETSLTVYEPETVVVAMYGGFKQIGRTGLMKIPACVNQALTAVKCNKSLLVPSFLLRVLNHRVDYWRSVASSSRKDPNITSKEVREFPIPLPPTLAEQEAIAGALSDADAWIESLEQLIAKKRKIKQGAMQELLTGKRRLPGFRDTWLVKRLGDIAHVSAGGTPSRSNRQYWDGEIPWVTTTEIDFETVTQTAQYITSEGLANSAAKLLPVGTLLMALYGQGKTRGKIGILGIEAATNQACAAIEIRDASDPRFVMLNLVNRYDEIRSMSNNGNQENLNGKIVKSIVVALPQVNEQLASATRVSVSTTLSEATTKVLKTFESVFHLC